MLTDAESQTRDLLEPIKVTTVSQGAEAIIYETQTHPYMGFVAVDKNISTVPQVAHHQQWYIVKCRPKKPYRHEILDAQLTKHRTLAEARLLQKARSLDISVPEFVFADPRNGVIWMVKIRGRTLKQWIWDMEFELGLENRDLTPENSEILQATLNRVGAEIAKLHQSGIVHGDLTTSNVMLDEAGAGVPVLIDFGLASVSTLAEDMAVDLYVLERAVESTHPIHSASYKEWLLHGYCSNFVVKKGTTLKDVYSKLEQVRLRGRKRSMVG